MAKKRAAKKKAPKATKVPGEKGLTKAAKGSPVAGEFATEFRHMLGAIGETNLGSKSIQHRYPPEVFEKAEQLCESYIEQALASVAAGPEKREGMRQAADQNLELIFESDRGCVLIAAARVEELLYSITEQILCETDDEAGKAGKRLLKGMAAPLGTAWARETYLFATGVLDLHQKKFVEALRELRNDFAHQASASTLTDGAVDKILAHLEEEDRAAVDIMGSQIGGFLTVFASQEKAPFGLRFAPSTARMRFIFGTVRMMKRIDDDWKESDRHNHEMVEALGKIVERIRAKKERESKGVESDRIAKS